MHQNQRTTAFWFDLKSHIALSHRLLITDQFSHRDDGNHVRFYYTPETHWNLHFCTQYMVGSYVTSSTSYTHNQAPE